MKKKRTVLSRLLAGALCALMMLGTLPLSLISFAAKSVTEPTPPDALAALSDHRVSSEMVTDIYGNPVHLHCYARSDKTYTASAQGKSGSVVILYVMNTNTERIGKSGDADIVSSMLERGFYVIVADYAENPVISPDLDWSIQSIRTKILKGTIATPGRGTDTSLDVALNYVVPAGYNITYGIPYFAYDLDGAAGTLERIVEIWNNDFKSVKRDSIVYWYDDAAGEHKATDPYDPENPKHYRAGEVDVAAGRLGKDYGIWFSSAEGKDGITNAALAALDPEEAKAYRYTYIGNTKARDIYDCTKADGSFIDLVLRMDIIYPTGNVTETPVMVAFSSGYTRASALTSEMRPQLTGFLFSGYTGVVSDYGLVPMSRNDHYGYFCGNSQQYSVSGDNYTYSLAVYNGLRSDTALLRTLRKLGTDGIVFSSEDERERVLDGSTSLRYRFDTDAFGGYGNSKAGPIIRLGAADPTLLEEIRHLPGHIGESRYDLLLNPDFCTYEKDGESVTYYTDPYYTVTDGVAAAKDTRVRLPRATVYPELSSRLNLTYGQCGACADTVTEGHAPIFANGTQQRGGDGSSYYTFYRDVFMNARENDLPFYGLISPNVGHSYGYGVDGFYGIDTYYAFHRFANYWLQNGDPSCEIIDVDTTRDIGIEADKPIDRIYEFDEGSAIRLQFIGVISRSEIQEKVTVIDSVGGEAVAGEWISLFGGTQWKFVPEMLKDATYYTVTVPKSLTAENGKTLAEGKNLTFRTESGSSIIASEASGNRVLTDGKFSYFIFDEGDYDSSYETLLRFTVTEDAANTVEVFGAAMADAASYEEVTAWEKVGERCLVGAGTYSVDVTEFTKGKSGRLVFRLGTSRKVGKTTIHTIDFDSSESRNLNDHRSGGAVLTQYTQSDLCVLSGIPGGREGRALKFSGFLQRYSWINADGALSCNYVDAMVYGFTLHYFQDYDERTFDESDYGRRFRISFDVYDETSRNLYLGFSKDMTTVNGAEYADFENSRYTFRTEAGKWKTYTVEQWVTDPSLYEIFAQKSLNFGIQNKTALIADDGVAVCPADMADASGGTAKASHYAGEKGLSDDYTIYHTLMEAKDDGKIHIRHADESGTALYIDNIVVEEIVEQVPLAASATLSLHTTETKEILPALSAAVSSSDPTASLDSLTVSGGTTPEDDGGKKVYLRYDISLFESRFAEVVFSATGDGQSVSVYGVSDLADWTAETITARSAPAIDPTSGKVDPAKVYGGAPLAAFRAKGKEKITLDITAFVKSMKEAGADSVTLLLTSDSAASGTALTTLLFNRNTFPSTDSISGYVRSGGFAKGDGVTGLSELDGVRMLTFAPYNENCTLRYASPFFPEGTSYTGSAMNRAWTKDDVGKRVRVTFTVRRTDDLSGDITLTYGMMRSYDVTGRYFRFKDSEGNISTDAGGYGFGFYTESGAVGEGTVTLKAGEYTKKVTYEFTVTEGMFAKDVYRIKDSADASLDTYEGSFAISYFGMKLTADSFSGTAADRLADAEKRPALAFGSIAAEELSAGTRISPCLPAERALSSYLFDNDTVRSTYIRPGGFGMNWARDPAAGDEQVVRYEDDNAITFAPFNDGCTIRNASVFFPSGTVYQNSAQNRAWTKDDVGKRIRVTFTVERTDNIEQDITLRYGMMRAYDLRKSNTSYTAKNEDGTVYTDPADYGFGFYTKAGAVDVGELVLKQGEAAKTVTYEFTVTDEMFAKEVFNASGASQGSFAIAYLGFRVATEYGNIPLEEGKTLRGNPETRPTLKFREGMSAAEVVDDTDLMPLLFNRKTLPNADYNGIWFRAAGYAKADEVAYPKGEDDATRTFVFTPFDAGCTLRNASILFPVGTTYSYSTQNRAWSADDVGKTMRVTFTVRRTDTLDRDITLRYGMMRGIDLRAGSSYTAKNADGTAYTDPADYGFGFYERSGAVPTGELLLKKGEAETTVTYTFTVTEEMSAKEVFNAGGESQGYFAIAYLGFQITADYGADGYTRDELRKAENAAYRPVVEFSSMSAEEVNYTSQKQTEAVTVGGSDIDRADLWILGKDSTLRTGIKKSAFSFLLPAADATEVFLRLPVTAADGEILRLYVLPNVSLSAPLTYENFPEVVGDPYAAWEGAAEERKIDITSLARKYPGQSVTFVLLIEEESADVTLDTPTIEVTRPKSETFDPAAFRVKANITLSSDFLYHLYVPVLPALTGLTLEGEVLDLPALPTKVIDGTLSYVVTRPIVAKEGADSFPLTAAVNADGKTLTGNYTISIPNYAKKITDGDYDDTTKTLMRDMLSYISASMTYFGTSTEEKQKTVTDIVGENYNAHLTAASVGLEREGTATDSGGALNTVCLHLSATPAFVFYLKEGKENLAPTFRFTAESGAPLTVKTKRAADGRTYLEVTTYAYGMGDLLTFTYGESGEYRGTYHLAAYYGTTDEGNENLKTLLVRLAKYSAAAKTYRDSFGK